MKYDKKFRYGVGFARVGRKAYELSKTWKLGIHAFISGGDFIFRICYLRTKKATYYWQFFVNVKKHYNTCN